MPRLNLPAALVATLARPTISRASSTRALPILFAAAMNRRCDRADRFGWIQLASSRAPIEVIGCFSRL